MSPRSASEVAAEEVRLYREVERLTEEFCARVRAGNDSGSEAFNREREAILQRIWAMGPAPEPVVGETATLYASWRESAAAIERIMDLDRELLRLLEDLKTRVGDELAELGRGRRTLAAYRGPTALSPVFMDRMG